MKRRRLNKKDTILIADDEPMFLGWLTDFIVAKGFKTDLAVNVTSAIDKLNESDFGAVVVDLNIPEGPRPEPKLDALGTQSDLYVEFPGLCIAKKALFLRNSGNRVIIYSVYQNEDIAREVYDLRCKCINKGQPGAIKEELLNILTAAKKKAAPKRKAAVAKKEPRRITRKAGKSLKT